MPTNLFNGMSTSTFLRLCTQAPRTSMRDGGKAPDDCSIPTTVPVWRKTRGQGNLVRHGIAAIVVSDPYIRPQRRGCHCFSRLPSAYVNRKAMRWNTGKWIGKGRNHIHRIYQWEEVRRGAEPKSVPGAGRLTSECPEHPHKALMAHPPCQRVERCIMPLNVMIRRWRPCLSWRASRR